jgi:hypothetical protein
MVISRSFLLTINGSDKVCIEKHVTHFIFKNIFEKVPLWDNVWKYGVAREVTDVSPIFGQVMTYWKAATILWFICNYIYIDMYIYTYTNTHKHINVDVTYLENWGRILMHVYQTTNRHILSFNILQCNNKKYFLYHTVATEKAAKHIVANKIRKWPHRETFSASSMYCMNLWIKGTMSLHWKYQCVKFYWSSLIGFSFRG